MTARSGRDTIGKGILLGFGLQILQIPLMLFLSPIGWAGMLALFSLLYIGATQLIYMVPAILVYAGKHQWQVVKGLCITGSVIAVLNTLCWGALMMPAR